MKTTESDTALKCMIDKFYFLKANQHVSVIIEEYARCVEKKEKSQLTYCINHDNDAVANIVLKDLKQQGFSVEYTKTPTPSEFHFKILW